MAALIFDASAIVKRHLAEPGSAWVRGLTDPASAHQIFITRVTWVEVTAAIARRGRGGLMPASAVPGFLAQFRHDALHQYNIVEITPALLARAERLAEIHALRGYDAVQLAATSELNRSRYSLGLSRLKLVSSDQELNAAALAEGVDVDDPATHP